MVISLHVYFTKNMDGLPYPWKPSCRHATALSSGSQVVLQIVPQALFKHTSSLPDKADSPPASLRSPVVQFDCAVVAATENDEFKCLIP